MNDASMKSKYYKSSELCKIFGITNATLRNWTRLEKFPKPVRIGATSFFDKEEFEKFIRDGGKGK